MTVNGGAAAPGAGLKPAPTGPTHDAADERRDWAAVSDLIARREAERAGYRAFRRLHREVKKLLDGAKLAPNVRERIGDHWVTAQPISGGGYEVGVWTSTVYEIEPFETARAAPPQDERHGEAQ